MRGGGVGGGQAAVCPPSPCKHTVTALFCLIDLFSSGLLGRRLSESGAPESPEDGRCNHHVALLPAACSCELLLCGSSGNRRVYLEN